MNDQEQHDQINILLSEIEEKIEKIKSVIGTDVDEDWEQRYARRMNILTDIFDKGGVVTDKELREIAERHRMDMRGVGGFFVGDGSLVKISNDRTALTERGRKDVEDWKKDHKDE